MVIEFLGIPRERAGIPEIEVTAQTLGEALGELSARCPGLSDLITARGLHPSIAANLTRIDFAIATSGPRGSARVRRRVRHSAAR